VTAVGRAINRIHCQHFATPEFRMPAILELMDDFNDELPLANQREDEACVQESRSRLPVKIVIVVLGHVCRRILDEAD
jgi:hypothetical protein